MDWKRKKHELSEDHSSNLSGCSSGVPRRFQSLLGCRHFPEPSTAARHSMCVQHHIVTYRHKNRTYRCILSQMSPSPSNQLCLLGEEQLESLKKHVNTPREGSRAGKLENSVREDGVWSTRSVHQLCHPSAKRNSTSYQHCISTRNEPNYIWPFRSLLKLQDSPKNKRDRSLASAATQRPKEMSKILHESQESTYLSIDVDHGGQKKSQCLS